MWDELSNDEKYADGGEGYRRAQVRMAAALGGAQFAPVEPVDLRFESQEG